MKKKLIVGVTAVAAISMLAGCSPQPNDVKTGSSNSTEVKAAAAQEQEKTSGKRFDAKFSKDFKFIELNVRDIVIKPDQIEVGINYKATGSQKVSWYPDQEGQLVIGDMQLSVDPWVNTNLFTGDIMPGTKSDGVLVFKPAGEKKIDVNKVTNLKFHLGDIIPDDGLTIIKTDFEIPVK